jgi:hypothetical protein
MAINWNIFFFFSIIPLSNLDIMSAWPENPTRSAWPEQPDLPHQPDQPDHMEGLGWKAKFVANSSFS